VRREVDVATGQVELLRYIVGEDCGAMINPNVVEGQIAGGTVQGIGGALLEHIVYDEDGNPLSTTFMDYLLPTASEVPAIEYGHVETTLIHPGNSFPWARAGCVPAHAVGPLADPSPLGIDVLSTPLGPNDIHRPRSRRRTTLR
jgi:carbon-monoxide dehydrogenase large subunit